MSTPATPSNPARPHRKRVAGIRRPRVAGRVPGSAAEPTTPEPTPAGGIDVLDAPDAPVDLVKRPETAPGPDGDHGAAADLVGDDPGARGPVDPADETGEMPAIDEAGEMPESDKTGEDGDAVARPSGKRQQRRRPAAAAGESGRASLASRLAPVRRLRVPTAALAAAAVLLVALAGFFAVQSALLRGTPSAQNTALVDVGATAQVTQQVSDALAKVYSFDYARLDQNEAAARTVITPAFESSFQSLFKQVRELAPQQKAVVSATVNVTAVRSITDDTAVLLVFLDQQATRAADNGQAQQLAAAGRLTVTAQRVDGTWKIADVVPQ